MLSKFEHCLDFHNVLCPFLEILARALLSKHLLVFKTSWRHVLKTTSTRLQRNNFSSSKTSSKRLEDVLEDEKLLSWRHFKVIFKTCLEDVLKTSWTKQNIYWDICIKPWPTNKYKSVSNKSISHKSIFHESKANPKCIN